jgi:hypothetical protein
MIDHRKMTAYSSKDGRRFALTVAAAFALIAAFTLWRNRDLLAAVTGTIAAILLVAGVTAPARLGPVERGWMRFAGLISRVTTPVFMGIVYFLVLTPAGVIRRTVGHDPLDRPLDNDSYWVKRTTRDREVSRRRMERQF